MHATSTSVVKEFRTQATHQQVNEEFSAHITNSAVGTAFCTQATRLQINDAKRRCITNPIGTIIGGGIIVKQVATMVHACYCEVIAAVQYKKVSNTIR